MRDRVAVTIWVCLFVRLLFYASVTPLWEGFDEYSHFGVMQSLVAHGRMPSGTERLSREVDASLRLVPVPYAQRSYGAGAVSEDVFWRLPQTEREQRLRALAELPV